MHKLLKLKSNIFNSLNQYLIENGNASEIFNFYVSIDTSYAFDKADSTKIVRSSDVAIYATEKEDLLKDWIATSDYKFDDKLKLTLPYTNEYINIDISNFKQKLCQCQSFSEWLMKLKENIHVLYYVNTGIKLNHEQELALKIKFDSYMKHLKNYKLFKYEDALIIKYEQKEMYPLFSNEQMFLTSLLSPAFQMNTDKFNISTDYITGLEKSMLSILYLYNSLEGDKNRVYLPDLYNQVLYGKENEIINIEYNE